MTLCSHVSGTLCSALTRARRSGGSARLRCQARPMKSQRGWPHGKGMGYSRGSGEVPVAEPRLGQCTYLSIYCNLVYSHDADAQSLSGRRASESHT